jgi:uncharacterized protein (TIGR00369 family)
MELTLAQVQSVINTCEFDRWLGLTAMELDETGLTVRMPVRREILGTPKIDRLHGGAVSTLIDAAGCYLLIALNNKRVSTVDMIVDYLRPAHGDMTARSRVVKLGRTICVVAVEVTGGNGKLVATGRLAIAPSNIPIGREEMFAARAPATAG